MKFYLVLVVAVGLIYRTDALTFDTATAVASVSEDAAVDAPVYQIVFDATPTGTVTYVLTGDEGKFKVSSTGEIQVAAQLDHEDTPSYTISITASTTAEGTTDTPLNLTVTVTNVKPAFGSQLSGSVRDTCPAGTVVGTFKATDPGDSAVTHTLESGDDSSDFTLDQTTGVLKVASDSSLDAAATPKYTLEITAADSATIPETSTATVTITVIDGPCDNAADVLVTPMLTLVSVLLTYMLA